MRVRGEKSKERGGGEKGGEEGEVRSRQEGGGGGGGGAGCGANVSTPYTRLMVTVNISKLLASLRSQQHCFLVNVMLMPFKI